MPARTGVCAVTGPSGGRRASHRAAGDRHRVR
jgi:hypothetical protein